MSDMRHEKAKGMRDDQWTMRTIHELYVSANEASGEEKRQGDL